MNTEKDTINWALAGTGVICNKFLEGLRAAGGHAKAVVSRTQERAEEFAARKGIEKAYNSYELMLEDKSIDAVYIGTPHTSHKDLAVSALKAKKAVLCEKPAAVNSRELGEILLAAHENNVFFMEAMWTRFLPPLQKTREWLSQGIIGDVKMVQSNFGFRADYDPKNRLFDLNLGGGALLDVGIYPLSIISMTFGGEEPFDIKSQLNFGESGVDEEDAVILSYSKNRIAYASAAIRTEMKNDTWIYGSKGMIHIPDYIFAHSASLILEGKEPYHYLPKIISNGYNYEAQEVMNCIRDGKTENPVMAWDESLKIMKTMDRIRSQWDFRYPCEA